MNYHYLDSTIEKDELILPNSDKINPFLLKNNNSEALKAIDFINSEAKFLYIHGFMGTGKRQFINYLTEFIDKEVIILEYYCKAATVCDDILLHFNDIIDNNSISKAVNLNVKITTLGNRFLQNIESIKKPFLIILHSFDDVEEENLELIKETFSNIAKEENVKLIVSTAGTYPDVMGELNEDVTVFLKAFNKEIFSEFLQAEGINISGKIIEDFYEYTGGYYYYLALTIKIIQAMKISLSDFLQKFKQSNLTYDSFLSATYLNLVPTTIRNFFWFLRTLRHGMTLNALALLELYDEFSIEYLKSNLMIFQVDETLFVQDYFLQKIDISIPDKTQVKLHKYIIGIYEKQLKESLKNRSILISRQALRAEIEYHNKRINEIENGENKETNASIVSDITTKEISLKSLSSKTTQNLLKEATDLYNNKKYTEAIEAYKKILDDDKLNLQTVIEIRNNLAKIYKQIGDYTKASYYYELIETYYIQNKELINLNYLYYDMSDLFFKMYKIDRSIETIKKVIYSVDTPQSLMVSSCTLLGNIYSETNKPKEAFEYYKKALESADSNLDSSLLAELYFKYALALDDKGKPEEAFEYYDKCISIGRNNPYIAFAYSNMASCYFDNETYDEAWTCFKKAYDLDKNDNNYDGIYYNASHLAKIALKTGSKEALNYLLEAKQSADFINDEFYILESTLALGDFYYNNPNKHKESLTEYFNARNVATKINGKIELAKIERRINDMKLRMRKEDFEEIENKYDR